jgi:hypothetical protein
MITHRGVPIPDRLKSFVERIPPEVTKSIDAVELIARCVQAEHYESEAATARRTRNSTLATGYATLADEVLAGSPYTAETRAEIAHCEKQIKATSGVLRKGYQQRLDALTGLRVDDRFVAEAQRLIKAQSPRTASSHLNTSAAAVVKRALDEAGLTITKKAR